MKLPLSWLKEYIDFQDDIEGLSKKLTFSGLEVENIQHIGTGIDDIIVAQINTVTKHPNADKLNLCTIHDGTQDITVVCGAPNVRPGMKTAFAPVGATLPGNFKIKKAKIRGEKSFGMLCAEDELGLGQSHNGIIQLPDDTPIGTPLKNHLPPPDTVFDLEITPNRPDCLSIIGIARDLSPLYNTHVKYPDTTLTKTQPNPNHQTHIDIQAPQACPRYTARTLSNLTIAPSPHWMQRRLTLAGIRPINNIIDITNYVMLETGQPLHAFDHSKLNGNQINIRHATQGETLTTLDGTQHKLQPHHLIIADPQKPIALAGIMGGANSDISDTTHTLLLETAQFDSKTIRHAAKELDANSESSHRYARGVDINAAHTASQRAAHLLQKHANATLTTDLTDNYPNPITPWTLTCRWQRINSLIGLDIPRKTIRQFLEGIELTWVKENDQTFTLQIPTFRNDLTREVDLIEEISRLYGLDNIPAPSPHAQIVPQTDDTPSLNRHLLRTHLLGLGLTEIVNYSLTSQKTLDQLDPENKTQRIILPHPISQDQSILRTTLLPQLTETLARNKAYQNHEAALFELGRTYLQTPQGTQETLTLSAGIMGPVGRGPLDKRKPLSHTQAYAQIKGLIEALAQATHIGPLTFTPCDHHLFAKGHAAHIHLDGQPIGRIGLLDPQLAKTHRMSDPIGLAEIQAAPLYTHMQQHKSMTPPPAYPGSTRDAALLLDRNITHAQILDTIKKYAPPELEKTQLFDIFINDKDPTRKSMAYSCHFRSPKRTLTDDDLSTYHNKILDGLKKDLNAELRDH